MKRIIVACGSGVATSQMVVSKVQRLLNEKGVPAQVDAIDLKSLDYHIKQASVYIAITKPEKDYPIPTCNGIAFLTGIGLEQELQKLIHALQ